MNLGTSEVVTIAMGLLQVLATILIGYIQIRSARGIQVQDSEAGKVGKTADKRYWFLLSLFAAGCIWDLYKLALLGRADVDLTKQVVFEVAYYVAHLLSSLIMAIGVLCIRGAFKMARLLLDADRSVLDVVGGLVDLQRGQAELANRGPSEKKTKRKRS